MQGHIHKRIRTDKSGKQSVNWYVVLEMERGANGARRQKWHGGYRTRKEAEAARARLVNEVNTGLYIPPTGTSFKEWVEDNWLSTIKSQLKPSTWDSYSRNMKLHVLPVIGGVKLRSLTPSHLDKLYAELAEHGNVKKRGLAPKTIRYIHTTIHKALGDAVRAGLIAANPAERANPPKIRANAIELNAWTAEQLGQFLESARDNRLYVAFRLAAMTGMRRGEILGLMWKDIDFEHSRLSVRRNLVSVAYQVSISTPKTHQARVIDLDKETVELLREHKISQQNEASYWGEGYQRSGSVFTREDGSHVHPESLSDRFESLERKCPGLPIIRFHDLRHSHASIALAAGIAVKVISERLGHETPAFTLKQYAHVLPGMQAEAASAIAALVSRSKEK